MPNSQGPERKPSSARSSPTPKGPIVVEGDTPTGGPAERGPTRSRKRVRPRLGRRPLPHRSTDLPDAEPGTNSIPRVAAPGSAEPHQRGVPPAHGTAPTRSRSPKNPLAGGPRACRSTTGRTCPHYLRVVRGRAPWEPHPAAPTARTAAAWPTSCSIRPAACPPPSRLEALGEDKRDDAGGPPCPPRRHCRGFAAAPVASLFGASPACAEETRTRLAPRTADVAVVLA